MGWILEFVGVILGSAVIPITLAVTSAYVSPYFITYAPPFGTACALAAWLGVAKGLYGEVNIITTFDNWPMFAGCTVSLLVPLIIWLCMRPFVKTPYDWDLLFLMVPRQPLPSDMSYTHEDDHSLGLDWNPQELSRASFIAKTVTGVLCLIFLVIIPFPMYGTGYIMSRKFFIGWTVVVFLWSWVAAMMIWFLPVWQSRSPLAKVVKGIFYDLTGKGKVINSSSQPDDSSGLEVRGVEEVKEIPPKSDQ